MIKKIYLLYQNQKIKTPGRKIAPYEMYSLQILKNKKGLRKVITLPSGKTGEACFTTFAWVNQIKKCGRNLKKILRCY